MKSKTIVIFLVKIFSITLASDFELPPDFPRCSRNDPNLDKCLMEAAEAVRPYLKNGVSKLHVPSISPLVVYELVFEQNSGTMNYFAKLLDGTLSGLDDYKIQKITTDFKKFEIVYDVPILEIEGGYEIEGKVLNVAMKGKGHVYGNISNLHTQTVLELKEVTKHDKKYLEITKIKTDLTADQMHHFEIDGLSGGDEYVDNTVSKIITENKDLFLEQFIPALERAIEEVIETVVLRHIFKIPSDKLFPLK